MSKQELPNHRLSLRDRLRQMTRDELIFALRRTAEGDRTHCKEWFEKIDNNRDEVFEILCEESEYLDEASGCSSKNH